MSRAERTRRIRFELWRGWGRIRLTWAVAAPLVVASLLASHGSSATDAGDPPPNSPPIATPGAKTEQPYRAIRLEPLQLIETFDTRKSDDPEAIVDGEPYDPGSSGITPDDVALIQKHFQSAIEAELKHDFEMATGSGPQTLRLEAVLIGLELDREAWLKPAAFKFETAPVVTLVIRISDSLTGEIVQQLAIKDGPVANRLEQQSAAVYWEHLRRLFRRLAIRTRWLLADPPE